MFKNFTLTLFKLHFFVNYVQAEETEHEVISLNLYEEQIKAYLNVFELYQQE